MRCLCMFQEYSYRRNCFLGTIHATLQIHSILTIFPLQGGQPGVAVGTLRYLTFMVIAVPMQTIIAALRSYTLNIIGNRFFSAVFSLLLGQPITDRHGVVLPPTLPPGTYQIVIGLYGPDGVRLMSSTGEDAIALSTVTIQ